MHNVPLHDTLAHVCISNFFLLWQFVCVLPADVMHHFINKLQILGAYD
jgi:hypothetical protein